VWVRWQELVLPLFEKFMRHCPKRRALLKWSEKNNLRLSDFLEYSFITGKIRKLVLRGVSKKGRDGVAEILIDWRRKKTLFEKTFSLKFNKLEKKEKIPFYWRITTLVFSRWRLLNYLGRLLRMKNTTLL